MSILNEAILDAKMIRESAKKVALNALKEKYSDEYRKNFKNTLFQQLNEAPGQSQDKELPEEDFNLDELGQEEQTNAENNQVDDLGIGGGGDSLGGDLGANGQEKPENQEVMNAIPHAFKDKNDTCQCPEKDEELTIDLGDLSQSINDEVMDNLGDSPVDREQFSSNMDEELPMNDSLDDEDEKFELNRESLERFLDLEDELKDKISELSAKNRYLTEKLEELIESNQFISSKLEKTNVELKKASSLNLKLLYKNKVLSDASLNERQKRSMLENISKLNNNEAEMLPNIYEMLKEAIGGARKPAQSESLFEITNGKGNNFFIGNNNAESGKNETNEGFKRWKQLARIIED